MTQSDFHSAFRNLLHEPLPPAPDPRRLAFELFSRDQKRTHVLAVLSLLFWVLGTAGIFLLVFSLNRVAMDAQLHASEISSSGGPIDHFVHHSLPPIAFTKICAVIETSVVALLIAAMLTVALVFSSRQATLNRINLSLMQISEQLMQSRPASPGEAPPSTGAGSWYSIPPTSGWPASSMLIKLLLALVLVLLVGVPMLWLGARSSAQRAALVAEHEAMAEMDAHRRLSPFEAVEWKGSTPRVQVGGKWYELISMDGLSAGQIVARCEAVDPMNWQKRFEEDLVEVLVRTGHPIGNRTMLEVKDPETGQVRALLDVPMTHENRDALWQAASTRPSNSR